MHGRANGRGAVGKSRNVNGRGQSRFELRQEFFDAVHDLNDVRAGLPLDIHDDRRNIVHPGGELRILDGISDIGDIGQNHRRAVSIGDHQRAIIFAGEKLVIGVDFVGLLRSVEIALGLVDTGLLQAGANVVKVDAVGGKRGGIGLNADRRFLATGNTHQPHARQLRDLLRQPCVREILDLREGKAFRGQGQGEDGRVGRIGFAVDRR